MHVALLVRVGVEVAELPLQTGGVVVPVDADVARVLLGIVPPPHP
jgi:hypothetical protein